MKNAALYTSAVFFAIGTAAHVVRLFSGFTIVIDGIDVPTWASYPAAIFAAAISLWMVAAARR